MIACSALLASWFISGTITQAANSPASNDFVLHSPSLELPADSSVSVCLGDSVCYTVRATDNDNGDRLTLTLLSGPINFPPFARKSPLEKLVCFKPSQSGEYRFIWKVVDPNGSSDIDTVVFNVTLGNPPAIEDQYFSAALCSTGVARELQLIAKDPDGDPLSWELLSGAGSIDKNTGLLTYTPSFSGGNAFVVRVSSDCGFDVAKVLDSIVINQPPVVTIAPRDTALCGPGTVCVSFKASDPDRPFSLLSNIGEINKEGSEICFVADTNGTYRVILTVTDTCGAKDVDTAYVTVKIAPSNGSISCPADTAIFICAAGEICLPKIESSYENVNTSLGRFNSNGQLCFIPDTAGTYVFILTGSDECSSDTCRFKVTVGINTPPVLSIEDIDPRSWCGAGEICVPLTYKVNDPDSNVVSVTVSFGVIEDGNWCFDADSAGLYEATVTVTDACGQSDKQKIQVLLIKNKPPVVYIKGFDTTLCATSQLCVPFTIESDDAVVITAVGGVINQDSSAICFTPDGSGTFRIILTAIDPCGVQDVDTAVVNVTLNSGGELVCPADKFIKLCAPGQVCIDSIASSFATLTSNIGQIVDNRLCFNADTAGTYLIRLIGSNECGADTCEFKVAVSFNAVPDIEDISNFYPACNQPFIDVVLQVTDADGDSLLITSSIGTIEGSGSSWVVRLIPDTSGIYTFTIIASDKCSADTLVIAVPHRRSLPPVVKLGDDLDLSLCAGEQICIDAFVDDQEGDIQNVFASFGTYDESRDRICFTADTSGRYQIILSATDSCGGTDVDTAYVTVTINKPPTVSITDGISLDTCGVREICVPVAVNDDNIANVFTSLGVYKDGAVCFTPDSSGLYTLIVTVRDDCEVEAADTTTIRVKIDRAVTVSGLPDTLIYLCKPTELCLPFDLNDPDGDIATLTTNRGRIVNGRVCFVPYDSGQHLVIVTATDSCGNLSADTAVVTVKTDQGLAYMCPRDTTIFLCAPETLCFPLGEIPSNVTVNVRGTGVWYDAQKNAVCFYSTCCIQNNIVVEMTTPCGKTSCAFTVTLKTNSNPLVILPPDKTVPSCELGQICVPVGVSDANGNLLSITTNLGSYDALTQRVCFTADTSATYRLIVTATDSCGATDADTMNVTARKNSPPDVSINAPDSTYKLCAPTEICLPVSISDLDLNIESISVTEGATYDAQLKRLCFTADQAGQYCVWIKVTDSCGVTDSAAACVTVERSTPVAIECPSDDGRVTSRSRLALDGDASVTPGVSSVVLCKSDTVCVPLAITGDVISVNVIGGVYRNGEVCVFADTSGSYEVTVIVDGICNDDTCTFSVPVTVVPPASISCPGDQNILLCGPDTLCYPFEIRGPIDSVKVIGAGFMSPTSNLAVCVPLLNAGEFTTSVIVYGPCNSDTCSFTITATENRAPYVDGKDSTLTLCTLREICLPISYGDLDGNLKSVFTTLGSINLMKANQTRLGETTSEESGAPATASTPEALLCFTPDRFGIFEITITVTDSCDVSTSKKLIVTVNQGGTVDITCPTSLKEKLCDATTFCLPLTVNGQGYELTTSVGTLNGDTLCLPVDFFGTKTFNVRLIGTSECNADTCNFQIELTNYQAPRLACGVSDTNVFVCNYPTVVSVPFSLNAGSGVDSIVVTPANAVKRLNQNIIDLTLTSDGTTTVTVRVYGPCGIDSCSYEVTSTVNQPPTIRAPRDTAVVSCDLDTLCLPFTFSDAEDNLREVSTTLGLIRDNEICFKPNSYGTFQIILTATDSCGATAKDTVHLTFSSGDTVQIACPIVPIQITAPVPDTISILVPITPPGANVIVIPAGSGSYNSQTGILDLYVTQQGISNYTLIASSECSADTCDLTVDVGEYFPPRVDCTGSLDTTLCLTQAETLCVPISISGSNVSVSISPAGSFADGKLCIPVDTSGTYVVRVVAANEFAADTCISTIKVQRTTPPDIELPPFFAIGVCDTGEFCFPVDLNEIPYTLDQIQTNIGRFDTLTSSVCVDIDSAGVYTVIVRVTDSCGNFVEDTSHVTVTVNGRPTVSLPNDTARVLCDAEKICIPVSIQDDGVLEISNNFGDLIDNELCFDADTSGTYRLIVTATDSCGITDADTMNIRVTINRPPTISSFRDTSIFLCRPMTVCLPLAFNDPDAQDAVVVTSSRGTWNPATGICFVPYDSGSYEIIVTVTDKCGRTDVDTAVVHVETDQSIKLDCPRDTSVFLCQPETLCFPVGGIPQGATVKVSGTGATWNPATQSVCFYSDCCITNTITVSVTTACGTVMTCSFTVSVTTNSRPLVILPRDTTVSACDAFGSLCFPAGISDIDQNISNIAITGGTYDPLTNRICLTNTQPGVSTIVVTATDSCGLTDVDTMRITLQPNRPPTVSITVPSVPIRQCKPAEICLPISFSDLDGNPVLITTNIGQYDSATSSICFLPDGAGQYCITVIATDLCGVADTAVGCVTVEDGDKVSIVCPSQAIQVAPLCEPGEVCVDLAIVGTNYRVVASFGSFVDGKLCFAADSSGNYQITVIASAQCNSDTCVINIPVQIKDPVDITCLPIQQFFFCSADTACITMQVSSSVDSITVNSNLAYVTGRNSFCVPILSTGLRTIHVTAFGACGTDTCTVQVNGTINTPPVVQLGRDSTLTVCTIPEICINLTIEDQNRNIQSIVANKGTVGATKLCYTPTKYGVDTLIVTVTDSCGAKDADTAIVSINKGDVAVIGCPTGTQFASICKPDSVCIVVPITPANAVVTVSPNGKYNPATGTICVYVTQGGTIPIRVIATAQCGADTCEFNLQVTKNDPPNIICPPSIDTLMCLARPDTLCIPVTVTGTGVTVTVTPPAFYSGGSVCLPVNDAGTYQLRMIGSGVCGVDTCITSVTVRKDQPPVLTLPTSGLSFQRCPDDVDTICINGISVSDTEGDATLSKLCGPGLLSSIDGNGTLCFVPDTIGIYKFCIRGYDGCNEVVDTLEVQINLKPDCDVCVKFSFDWGECTPVGVRKSVNLNVETNELIGGFDLLLSFDASAMTFVTASILGTDIQGWEYFTWNLGGSSCGGTCPPGILRLVGIAEINNGPNHPPDSTLNPNGTLVRLDFLIKNDQTLGDQFIPISFIWYDCADNSVSDPTGQLLLVDKRIYNSSNALIWDEFNDIAYPENIRPFGLGAPDNCFNQPGKASALRCIDFTNGGICIVHPDSIDARGDVNLNGSAYEIADAVLFSNYFIYGISVFTLSIPGQTAATDVNADGLTLTVADLAFLIRVIVGDVAPIPKLNPYATTAFVETFAVGNGLTVKSTTESDLGAAYLVYDLSGGAEITDVSLGIDANQMDMNWAVVGSQLRILLFDMNTDRIASGERELVNISTNDRGSISLSKADFADYEGRPYAVRISSVVPDGFAVNPNYPNPFNPTTTLSFSLPSTSEWKVTIYDVTGATVREFDGQSNPGLIELQWDGTDSNGSGVASGVYFYRVEAVGTSQTRKMMLLK
jgi:hypothetical protein